MCTTTSTTRWWACSLAALATLAVGDPLDPATFVGPVVTEAAMERILAAIDRARADGADLLAGGHRLGGELAAGWFVAPTVFGGVDHHSDLARNEVFGPVQAVLRFSSEDEVLAMANDSPFGLGRLPPHPRPPAHPALRPGDRGRHRGRQRHGPRSRRPPRSAAYKQSGFGREGGRAGIEEMVRRKTVFVAP